MPAGENVLLERLAARIEGNPQDQRGWLMLARSFAGLGVCRGCGACRRAIELGSNHPAILTAYGETLVARRMAPFHDKRALP